MGRATNCVRLKLNNIRISIHALRGESDVLLFVMSSSLAVFQSTPSVGRATCVSLATSTHFLPFQSTPSVGRATLPGSPTLRLPLMISIHALRGESDHRILHRTRLSSTISIHALRGESDYCTHTAADGTLNFNPRPPWGERRLRHRVKTDKGQFQSTPSVGRATMSIFRIRCSYWHFNPRPPWGERRYLS